MRFIQARTTPVADSLAQQLESVQSAIRRMEAAEFEVMLGRRQFASVDLKALYDRERDLLNRIDRASTGGGIRTRRIIPRG